MSGHLLINSLLLGLVIALILKLVDVIRYLAIVLVLSSYFIFFGSCGLLIGGLHLINSLVHIGLDVVLGLTGVEGGDF